MQENAEMGDERLRSEIRDEQERVISAVRSATDHWEMAMAEHAFADLLERMADELEMRSAHNGGRSSSRSTCTPAVGGGERAPVCHWP